MSKLLNYAGGVVLMCIVAGVGYYVGDGAGTFAGLFGFIVGAVLVNVELQVSM